MGIPDPFTCLLRNLYAGQGVTVGTGYGTREWLKIRKGVHQSCIVLHSAYLTSIQSTLSEMPGWIKHKLESRLLGEISITLDMQSTLTTLMAESKEELKSFLKQVKRRVKKLA